MFKTFVIATDEDSTGHQQDYFSEDSEDDEDNCSSE